MLVMPIVDQQLHGLINISNSLQKSELFYYDFETKNSSPLRVFLLGPCHHVHLRGCGFTSLKSCETPLGNIDIDQESIF